MAVFKTKFAQNGDRNAIPQTSSNGSVNWAEGWTSDYSKNPLSGGKYIERQDMNGILYEITNAIETIANGSGNSGGSGKSGGSGVIEYTSNLSSNPLTTQEGGLDFGSIKVRFGCLIDSNLTGNGTERVIFKNPFANGCVSVVCTSIFSRDACVVNVDNIDKNGFDCNAKYYNNINADTAFYWVAFGF